MRDGFSLASQAAAWLEHEYCPHAAREVWDWLVRCNLLFGVVEAVRARADLDYAAELMSDRLDGWLAAFSDYAILPPETLGWIWPLTSTRYTASPGTLPRGIVLPLPHLRHGTRRGRMPPAHAAPRP